MNVLARRLFVAALGLGALLGASACKGGDGVVIPDTYTTSNSDYTLLYSTLGYDLAGPKRLLIRQNDPAAAISEGLAMTWRLIDADGNVALDGRASYSGTGWSIPVWTADFTALEEAGTYRVVVEAPDVQLATQAFAVDNFLLFRRTFAPVAIDNALAREAPIELDNGYFDGNGKSGGAPAHAVWVIGLIEAYERRGSGITEQQRQALRASISRSIDYLLLLSDPATGEFDFKSPTRPYGEEGAENTAAGMRALARYAATSQLFDAAKAERAFRRALLAEQWLTENAPEAYPPALRAATNYDLYQYASIDSYLLRAAEAVREEIGTYDLRTMERTSSDALPHLEAMYRMWRELPQHPDRQLWADAATAIAAQYKQVFAQNPFAVLPPGVTDTDRETTPEESWDEVATSLPVGEGDGDQILNAWFMSRAIDASFLADMTNDPELRVMAAAGVGWITGLNPGVPVERVPGTNSTSPVEAASFLTGVGARSAAPWSVWEWLRPRAHGTIVNGFLGDFRYDDEFRAAETSLAHDGLWLYAMTAYEDFLHPGRRAPATEAPAAYERAVHVASVSGSESGGTLQFLVRVADEAGASVPAVRVVVLWEGVRRPGESIENALVTNDCLTGGDGSCLVTLAADALEAERPIVAGVANLEHSELPYDVSADAAEKTASYP